ncbi:MAG TPA: tetratricopeptide repeat protein, partial [Thermoanaerobaculia bacterium]
TAPAPVRAIETPQPAIADLAPVADTWAPPFEEPAPPAVFAAPPITDLEPYPDLAEALLGEPVPAAEEEPPAAEEVFLPPLPVAEEGRGGEGLEPAPPVAEAPAPAAAEPVATATLGELYLRQGHLAEAERIFHEVLRREPDSAAAHEGLVRLAARRQERRPLAARELLAGYEPEGEAAVKDRKVFLLNSYLQHLRRGSQRDVS